MLAADSSEMEMTEGEAPPQWITIREASRRSGVPYSTLARWIKDGAWPVRVVELAPMRLRVSVPDFEAWLARLACDE
jgi:hypothetical protein